MAVNTGSHNNDVLTGVNVIVNEQQAPANNSLSSGIARNTLLPVCAQNN